jgi:hypothetical protein
MAHDMDNGNESPDAEHDRRELLRRGALLAAGAIGAGTAGAALSPQAALASDPNDVVLGQPNSASAQTSITFNSTTSTPLNLANSQGAALTLASTTAEAGASTPLGSLLSSDPDGFDYVDLQYVHADGDWGSVMTSSWETTMFAITPFRVLDTRNSHGRRNIVDGASNLDSLGRLKAGTSITVKLDEIFDDAYAWYGNLTAVSPVGSGYALVWPDGPAPNASTVNFAAGQTIANAFVCLSGFADPESDAPTVNIKAAQTTHVLLDISGSETWYSANAGEGAAAARSARSARMDARRRRKAAARAKATSG